MREPNDTKQTVQRDLKMLLEAILRNLHSLALSGLGVSKSATGLSRNIADVLEKLSKLNKDSRCDNDSHNVDTEEKNRPRF